MRSVGMGVIVAAAAPEWDRWPGRLADRGRGRDTARMDWGVGQYEHTAARLLEAARVVVDAAGLRAGDRVLDVGCGTGNAALEAAARGGRVIGVDPAPRLLEVARQEAARRGLDVEFRSGDAGALPVEDGAADDPELAAHLQASITTGSSCAYEPAEPVTWLT